MEAEIVEFVSESQERLADLQRRARILILNTKSKNTIRSYKSDWRGFTKFCEENGCMALPASADTVVLYLTSIVDVMATSSIKRHAAAIHHFHQVEGYGSPTEDKAVKDVLAGIRRAKGTAQKGKAPLLLSDIKNILIALPNNTIGIRDRAIVLFGFVGAFRRSELSNLIMGDLVFSDEGVAVTIRNSKTDQEGENQTIGIPMGKKEYFCPVRALQGWLTLANIIDGPVFRAVSRHGNISPKRLTGKGICDVIKRSVWAAQLDNPAQFSPHSLRSGMATTCALAGVEERLIQKMTRHRNRASVDVYVKEADLFRQNAAKELGL